MKLETGEKTIPCPYDRADGGRRLACQVLCQEMAGCVFLGRPSSLLPWALHLPLPSYAACWDAQTVEECRDSIARSPQPILISAAVRELCDHKDTLSPKIETSAYGMFTLMLGKLPSD